MGYACIGAFYQCAKKAVKSDSVIGSAFYSAFAGLFGKGAHRYLLTHSAPTELSDLLTLPKDDCAPIRAKLREMVLYPGDTNGLIR